MFVSSKSYVTLLVDNYDLKLKYQLFIQLLIYCTFSIIFIIVLSKFSNLLHWLKFCACRVKFLTILVCSYVTFPLVSI